MIATRARVSVAFLLAVVALQGSTLEASATAPTVAILPPQDRAGDTAAVATMDRALREALRAYGSVLGSDVTRDALRRLRLRDSGAASPDVLQSLGQDLGAEWLVSTIVHEANPELYPQVTLSVRVYSGETGETVWAGFAGASGLDGRQVLGLGLVEDLAPLVEAVTGALCDEFVLADSDSIEVSALARVGRVALVPLSAPTLAGGTRTAEMVTEAVRARLSASGAELVSPGRTHQAIRRHQDGRWGGITDAARSELREQDAADLVITGAVEGYEVGGGTLAPRPRVAVALRLVDAATGRILWTAWRERDEVKRRLFGLGQSRSAGDAAARVVADLVARLDEESGPLLAVNGR